MPEADRKAGGAAHPASPQRAFRRARRLLLVILLTLLATFGALEVLVRQIPLYPDSFAIPDDALGWRYQPNAAGAWFNAGCPREFTNQVAMNSQGAHDVEHVVEKPAGTPRVLVLGDSLVAALEVPTEALFFRRLESLLSARAGAGGVPEGVTEVIGFGFAGYGTAQEMLFYEGGGRRYAPDVVLLLFTPHNDFADNHPAFAAMSIDWVYTRPYFRPDETGVLVAEPPRAAPMPPLHRFLLEWSRLYRLLSLRARQFQPPVSLIGPEYEAARAESWTWTFAQLTALRDAVEADGARFGVVIDQSLLAESERAAVHAEIAAGLTARGIDHLSLLPVFQSAEQGGMLVRYACDGHWTPAGHALAAEAILPFVEQLLS
ncbi:MAG: SGNH/GDSL hydrolase family protein [Anaerolineae bacterium]|nr:SGNH/GDSL hydrolase family protein [Anaerolineae bacterium]NUQ05551.1 SGNH/GDSL hydrolase family protein [Anaerolineae bacterium]